MVLKQGDKSIEFSIADYQFPEIEPSGEEEFDYDANWLMCEIKYSDGKINKTYMDPCLMADELADMTEELSKILNGSEDGYISSFMEPYLGVAAARAAGKISMVFEFNYNVTAEIWEERKITTLLSQEEATEMVQSLKELVEKYPVR